MARGVRARLFNWVAERFPNVPWGESTRKGLLSIQRQMPRSHAEKYELKTIWYWYPLYCLGGLAFIAFIVLTITGIILGFFYVPNGNISFTSSGEPTSVAFQSMQTIMTQVPLGAVMRAMHHWSAHVMVATVFLHMCRVYFTGAYKKPRELNWLLGVVLLLLTLFFGYTGYLLPWNDLAWGAGKIGLELSNSVPIAKDLTSPLIFGDYSLGPAALQHMYWFHVFILPLVGVGLMVLHMSLVWIQGIAEPH